VLVANKGDGHIDLAGCQLLGLIDSLINKQSYNKNSLRRRSKKTNRKNKKQTDLGVDIWGLDLGQRDDGHAFLELALFQELGCNLFVLDHNLDHKESNTSVFSSSFSDLRKAGKG